MIVEMPDTLTSAIAKKLVLLRRNGDLVATARVLTLLIPCAPADVEVAMTAAQDAAREHPCRVILAVQGPADAPTRMDAEIRAGGDAGTSEIIVLRLQGELAEPTESLISALLLPDDPVVTWWPSGVPERPASTDLGRISQRRITDSAAEADPLAALERLAGSWTPGDTDLAWTRLTLWRTQLTSIVDQYGVRSLTGVEVSGTVDSPSTALLAAWLQDCLPQVPVRLIESGSDAPVGGVRFLRRGGDVELSRPHGDVADLYLPGQKVQYVSLPVRTVSACLAEELRRLDDDVVFGRVLTEGLRKCDLSPAQPTA